MCWKLSCVLRRMSAPSRKQSEDDVTNILIFGVTGMTGGAVAEAALGCAWFRVNGFTRTMQGEAYDELVSKGVTLHTGDMTKPLTIKGAMENIDTVFLHTTYWETMSVDIEYQQGFNVVNAAMQSKVKHLIYIGAEYSSLTAKERCKYFEGKAMVENYIVNAGIPYTIVHLGFCYENLLTVFKPHQTTKNEFAVALPMGDVGLNCGSIVDFGHCISKMALRTDSYVFKTIKLSTSYLTVNDIVEKLNAFFPDLRFYNPKIPVAAFYQFMFDGAEELASMFAHYRTLSEWDHTVAMELNSYNRSFEQWLKDTDKVFLEVLMENQETFATIDSFRGAHEMVKKKIMDVMPFNLFFSSPVSLPVPKVEKEASLVTQEEIRHNKRCRAFSEAHKPKNLLKDQHFGTDV
ncbi:nmrA-like family domain-containing protein 1 [Physella acuta]|uniref:nmrA-like family domain-containing protein 1 n=1 Tax=Physella acuta TaxID=109671 RepID=UPI0027DD1546|nr:nmrA-like family domain-containing protein 1 [Physella acuta]